MNAESKNQKRNWLITVGLITEKGGILIIYYYSLTAILWAEDTSFPVVNTQRVSAKFMFISLHLFSPLYV